MLKICCNHYISPQLSLQPLQTSERSWTWTAQDFSEGELVQETLALKFKTMEQARKFKQVFDEAQSNFGNESVAPVTNDAPVSAVEPQAKTLAELFKPKEGSWECEGCYGRNAADVTRCPSCETIKPGTAAVVQKVSGVKVETKTPANKSLAELFKPKEGSWECQGCLCRNDGKVSVCPSCEAAKPGTVASTAAPTTASSAFSFSGKGFSFTPKSSSATSAPIFGGQASTGMGFGGFSFSSPTPAPTAVKTQSPNASVNENEYYEEEENADIHFEPVIPLPDKIEVKTGEEDEEVLYCHRSKLLRLHDGEWKERGVGDIKILRHTATGKVRLVTSALRNSIRFIGLICN